MTFENVEPGTYYFKEVSSPVGKIVAEWTTGDSAESFERKLNVDTSYILCEVSAPEGYDLAEDTEFIIDAYGILSITSGPDAEKTSDTAQIGLFAILSIAAIVVVIIVLRRRKNS